jgi:hypothetical protein
MVEERAGFGEKAVEPGGGALADGQHAALAVFALANDQGAGGGIVVAVVEVGHFTAANAGGVEEFEHGAIAQAEGIGGVGDGEQALDFLFAEGFWQLGALFARQVEIGGGVGGDGAGAAEPGKEAPDAAEPRKLGVGDERLAAARTAVVMEEKLVGCEIGAGEGGGIVGAARIRPCGELPQRPAMDFDRWLRSGIGKLSRQPPKRFLNSRDCCENLAGLRVRRCSRLASFHRIAGISARCRHDISDQSGLASARLARNVRWLPLNLAGSSANNLFLVSKRLPSDSASRVMPSNSLAWDDSILISLANKTSWIGRLWPAR